MPHYDYFCTHCSYQEEIFQKMTDALLTNCPKCKQSTFKRKFGIGIGLQFQGSGFYATDYGHAAPPEKNQACSPEKEKAPSSGPNCGCGKTSCPS